MSAAHGLGPFEQHLPGSATARQRLLSARASAELAFRRTLACQTLRIELERWFGFAIFADRRIDHAADMARAPGQRWGSHGDRG